MGSRFKFTIGQTVPGKTAVFSTKDLLRINKFPKTSVGKTDNKPGLVAAYTYRRPSYLKYIEYV